MMVLTKKTVMDLKSEHSDAKELTCAGGLQEEELEAKLDYLEEEAKAIFFSCLHFLLI